MGKWLSRAGALLGIAMILGGIGLITYNRAESAAAGDSSAAALIQVRQALPQPAPAEESPPALPEPLPREKTMPVVEIDGLGYCGTLSIPWLELELPIIDEWSYDNLQAAPCRYSGSLVTEDLVICGHSFDTHFGRLEKLPEGEAVVFTAMDGAVYTYQALFAERLEATAIQEMTAGDYPLTLFSCTPDGRRRVTLRCILAAES